MSDSTQEQLEREILLNLRSINFPIGKRRSVKRHEKDIKREFVMGAVRSYFKSGLIVSKNTLKYSQLCNLLCKWISITHPNFKYTTIQVNNGGTALHVDKLNCGPSVVKGFGDYVGGKLWTLEQPYTLHCVKTKLGVLIDGNIPHITMPHTGERFSVVFFSLNLKQPRFRTHTHLRIYKQLGFPSIPSYQYCKKPVGKSKDALSEAARILTQELNVDPSVIGDFTNKTITDKIHTTPYVRLPAH